MRSKASITFSCKQHVTSGSILHDAYIYGYSLITTEVTRVQMTNAPAIEGLNFPMGAVRSREAGPGSAGIAEGFTTARLGQYCHTPRRVGGAQAYTVTFPAGQLPPVNGFWSITMYEIDQGWWFVPNSLNKFTVSPRNNLKRNADGSTTLYFQNQSPGAGKENNWLPAPKGDFILMLRMYWPKEGHPSILNGSWAPPHVVRAS